MGSGNLGTHDRGAASGALKTMVDLARSTIHGEVQIMDQAEIDGLMDMM